MMKLQVNNKPLTPEARGKASQAKAMKAKFANLEQLMDYVLKLEKRIEELENKNL
ncbi:hypothetical protein QFZ31_006657 [Neobacillus niacini]|uniref:hypothetical protein n=1 Tax=Neobacillus driksii TaxID=3035913 RepID=UPI00278B45C8|nr:hypothetical protein [Neobacillus niacini]MDQ0976605.1 hypothetical protein [Neobacillus niacini]